MTTTAIMTVEGVEADALKDTLLQALAGIGARLVPCDWSPDPDTIADACGRAHVDVLDLNPPVPVTDLHLPDGSCCG